MIANPAEPPPKDFTAASLHAGLPQGAVLISDLYAEVLDTIMASSNWRQVLFELTEFDPDKLERPIRESFRHSVAAQAACVFLHRLCRDEWFRVYYHTPDGFDSLPPDALYPSADGFDVTSSDPLLSAEANNAKICTWCSGKGFSIELTRYPQVHEVSLFTNADGASGVRKRIRTIGKTPYEVAREEIEAEALRLLPEYAETPSWDLMTTLAFIATGDLHAALKLRLETASSDLFALLKFDPSLVFESAIVKKLHAALTAGRVNAVGEIGGQPLAKISTFHWPARLFCGGQDGLLIGRAGKAGGPDGNRVMEPDIFCLQFMRGDVERAFGKHENVLPSVPAATGWRHNGREYQNAWVLRSEVILEASERCHREGIKPNRANLSRMMERMAAECGLTWKADAIAAARRKSERI